MEITETEEERLARLKAERERLKEQIAGLETDTMLLETNVQINMLNKELDALYRSLIYIPELHTQAKWEYKIYSCEGMLRSFHFWEKEKINKYKADIAEYQLELEKVNKKIAATEANINARIDDVKQQLKAVLIDQAELIENQHKESLDKKSTAESILPELHEKLRKVRSDINLIDNKIVELGSYYIHSEEQGKEPVEWIVLDETEDSMLLLSRYCIECHQFNPKHRDFTWESSEIRKWLNEDFINKLFSADEQSRIIPTTIINPMNSTYETPGCDSTTDRLFFLSIEEAWQYFAANNERAAGSTPYAKSHGAYEYAGASWWWLRTAGSNTKFAADVHISGAPFPLGDFGISFLHGVRPAMWVKK